jgi:hypothetical protein
VLAANIRCVVVAIHAAVPQLGEHGRVITIGSHTAGSLQRGPP